MKIGLPKEIKNWENRVGLTPSGVKLLIKDGHTVKVQKKAGIGSGFSDSMYQEAGAIMVDTAAEVYERVDLIVKVKEPQPEEYRLIEPEQIVFTYFHFAASKKLTEAMVNSGSVSIAYETITNKEGTLPLLVPMSQIAGRMSVIDGVRFMLLPNGGRGILPGGIAGVAPANIVVIGGGIVGTEAAKLAAGFDAKVTILDINPSRLLYLSEVLPANVTTLFSNEDNISKVVKEADLLIGAVLLPGAQAPTLVSEEMVKSMKEGAVIVDVAIDQGGCIATSEKTTHAEPTVTKHGVIHYGVTNMPGAVANTATLALTQVTLPYVRKIATLGYKKFAEQDTGFAKGINIEKGIIKLPELLD